MRFAGTVAAFAAICLTPGIVAQQAGVRTVYVAAQSGKGVPVPDLGATDFVVKEDGKVREIVKAELATAPLHVALLLDDGGLAINGIRQGAGQFIETLQGKGEFTILTIGARALTLVDFTSSAPALYDGIRNLFARKTESSDLLDGILQVTAEFQRRKAERPVIVAIAAETEEVSSAQAPVVLDEIQKSRAKFYYIGLGSPVTAGTRPALNANTPDRSTEAETASRNAVLGAAPKSSGGRSEQSLQPTGVPVLMKQFADEIAAHYAITYSTDAPQAKLSVESRRKGVTVRAPSRVGTR